MKAVAILTAFLFLFSCKKSLKDFEARQAATESITATQLSTAQITEQTGPDLTIVEYDTESWRSSPEGIYTEPITIRTLSDGRSYYRWKCPLANIAPQRVDGLNDFIFPLPYNSDLYGYEAPDLLRYDLFINGELQPYENKYVYYPAISNTMKGYDFDSARYYGDTGVIKAMTCDVYHNEATRFGAGEVALRLWIDPLKKYGDVNYANNMVIAGIKDEGVSPVTVDRSAADRAGMPKSYPLTVTSVKGRVKYNVLNFPNKAEYVCVERDGKMIAVWQYGLQSYTDNISGKHTYRVLYRNQDNVDRSKNTWKIWSNSVTTK